MSSIPIGEIITILTKQLTWVDLTYVKINSFYLKFYEHCILQSGPNMLEKLGTCLILCPTILLGN